MTERTMTASWTEWQGMVVDGTFYLDRYLGGTERSAVYFTDWGEQNQPAAIKLIAADADAETHLTRWKLASELVHPNLLRIYQAGRCELDGTRLLYVVMEYAEENLAEILRERPLNAEEAREMSCGILEALAALHYKGLVHGELKPSNIMAVGDQLKISSDCIVKAGSRAEFQCAYHAPELTPQQAKDGLAGDPTGEPLSASADIWSLGMTMVEALTQQRPENSGTTGDLELPTVLPAPFAEIAQHCLLSDPRRRWTVAGIRAHLSSGQVQTKGNQRQMAAPGKAAQIGHTAPTIANSIPASLLSTSKAAPDSESMQSEAVEAPLPDWVMDEPTAPGLLASYKPYLPVTLAALVFFATTATLFTMRPSRHGHRREAVSSTSAVISATKRPSAQASETTPPRHAAAASQPELNRAAAASAPTTQARASQASWVAAFSPQADSAPSAMSTLMSSALTSGALVPGAAIERPVPDVPARARRTIHGRVKVKVKVAVGPSGSVERASLDSHASSRYFAGIAMETARRWRFSPAQMNGQNVASEWLLKFEFRRRRTDIHPTPLTSADGHL